jgi:hypothetical protein
MRPRDPVVLEFCRTHGETDPERLILRLCRELLDRNPTQAGPTPLPVLGSIRLIRKVEFGPIPLDLGCSGLLVERDGGYVVVLEKTETEGRHHWSFAHEIVHTFFREIDRTGRSSLEQEGLCDLGAAELTMPADRFCRKLEKVGLSLGGIRALSEEFATSFVAAGRRAAELTIEPAFFLSACLDLTLPSQDSGADRPRLRVEHSSASARWPEQLDAASVDIANQVVIREAFEQGVKRSGRGDLLRGGANHSYCLIEAVGYSYLRRGQTHSTVAALLRLTDS